MPRGLSHGASSYSSDTWTILFDDFENSTEAESLSLTAAYSTGYRGGVGLHLPDRAAHAYYRESSWAGNGWYPDTDVDMTNRGTIEFYFKPDTIMPDVNRFLLLGHDYSPPASFGWGKMAISVNGGTAVEWAVGSSTVGVLQITSHPPLNPGQWYHIAVTWDTFTGMALYVNGVQTAQNATPTAVDSAPFFIGSSSGDSTLPGTFDKFRISARTRADTEFPSALSIRIDSPAGSAMGETWFQPFSVAYASSASESPAISVKLLLTTDTESLSGTEIVTGLNQIDTVSLSGVQAGKYRLIAVATTGLETAYAATDFLAIQTDTSSTIITVTQVDAPKACILTTMGLGFPCLREFRDLLLNSRIGRLLVELYYS